MQVIIFSYECEILNRELKHGGLLLENGVLNGGIVFFKLSKNNSKKYLNAVFIYTGNVRLWPL